MFYRGSGPGYRTDPEHSKSPPDNSILAFKRHRNLSIFSYLLRGIAQLLSLPILKTENPPRFRKRRFRGYRKSALRLSHVIKKNPRGAKVGGAVFRNLLKMRVPEIKGKLKHISRTTDQR